MICCDKSTDTWKTGLELYDDDRDIFLSSSSGVNHLYQVFAIIGDNSEEFDDNNNPVINPAKRNQRRKPHGSGRHRGLRGKPSKDTTNSSRLGDN
jgi:hypothetical protein